MSGFHSAQTSVGTTATLVAKIGSVPENSGVPSNRARQRSSGRWVSRRRPGSL